MQVPVKHFYIQEANRCPTTGANPVVPKAPTYTLQHPQGCCAQQEPTTAQQQTIAELRPTNHGPQALQPQETCPACPACHTHSKRANHFSG